MAKSPARPTVEDVLVSSLRRAPQNPRKIADERLDQPGTFQGHPTPEAARATLLVSDRPQGKQLAAISLTFMAGTKGAPTMPGRA